MMIFEHFDCVLRIEVCEGTFFVQHSTGGCIMACLNVAKQAPGSGADGERGGNGQRQRALAHCYETNRRQLGTMVLHPFPFHPAAPARSSS